MDDLTHIDLVRDARQLTTLFAERLGLDDVRLARAVCQTSDPLHDVWRGEVGDSFVDFDHLHPALREHLRAGDKTADEDDLARDAWQRALDQIARDLEPTLKEST